MQSRVTILCPQFDVGANTDVWDDALNSSTTKRKSMLGGYGIGTTPWERGRNWTSVIVEVVPGLLPGSMGTMKKSGEDGDDEGSEEDEDVLEIPVFVRIEYETEAQGAEEKVKDREGKERREVAFWCVLGVGRIVG
jgi:dynactin-4